MTTADDLDIRNAIARIAHLADMGTDADEYVDNFTADADWLMPGAPRHGHDDIKAGWLERREIKQTGPGSNSRHVVSTVAVQTDGTDTAVSDAYWIFYVDTTTAPKISLMGHYYDTWKRTPKGWKLAVRGITFG